MDDLEDRFVRRGILSFRAHFRTLPQAVASAPGRVNLIGEHLDYCGGRVLPFAIPNRTMVSLGPSPDGRFRFFSSRIGSEIVFAPDDLEANGDWGDHARGVIREYRELGLEVPALAGWVDSDVSLGGGLSSSASLAVAVATGLEHILGHPLAVEERARLCQRSEHRTVGVACGLMDQMAVVACERDHALLFDTRSGETRAVPVKLPGHKLLLADSRVPRELRGSGYNDRRSECEGALAKLGEAGWEIPDLRAVEADRLEAAREVLDEIAFRRVRHQVTENARVLAAVEALGQGDVEALGTLLDASHASLRDDFEVSHPDVDDLVEIIRSAPGVRGARMTGAGFGGFVLLLVEDEAAQGVADLLVERYYQPRERAAVVLEAGTGGPAARIDFPAAPSATVTPPSVPVAEA